MTPAAKVVLFCEAPLGRCFFYCDREGYKDNERIKIGLKNDGFSERRVKALFVAIET